MSHTVQIYAAYDRKAQYYLPIFQARSEVDAIRSFTDAVMGDTPLAKYPADYDLIRIGDLDTESGKIDPVWPVDLIMNGYVALDLAQKERSRYAKALSQQVDIEDLIGEKS